MVREEKARSEASCLKFRNNEMKAHEMVGFFLQPSYILTPLCNAYRHKCLKFLDTGRQSTFRKSPFSSDDLSVTREDGSAFTGIC